MVTHAELLEQGIARRQAIMAFIRTYLADNGYPPSVAEIADANGIAKNAVRHHLLRLKKDGKVTMTEGKYRSIRVLEQ